MRLQASDLYLELLKVILSISKGLVIDHRIMQVGIPQNQRHCADWANVAGPGAKLDDVSGRSTGNIVMQPDG